MTTGRTTTAAISFASSAYDFAAGLAEGLASHGFRVISDNHRLASAAATWGVHKFDLIDQVVDADVAFCIVLLTPDFITEKWASYRRCKLVQATLDRKGLLLPVRIGDHAVHLRGISEPLGELVVQGGDWGQVVTYFLEKTGHISEVSHELLGSPAQMETILHLYNPRLVLTELEHHADRAQQIGYDLFEARDPLTKRATYFLSLYRGANLGNTSDLLQLRHRQTIRDDPLIVLIPKEPGQTKRERRLENVKTLFDATAVFYVDQFIWEQCTTEDFRERQPRYELPTFIDPNIDGSDDRGALAAIDDWFGRDGAPVLIIQGSGGIGKTTVAKAYANKLIERGNQRVLFLDETNILQYLRQHQRLNWPRRPGVHKLCESAPDSEPSCASHRRPPFGGLLSIS